jgi:hypothetical protein
MLHLSRRALVQTKPLPPIHLTKRDLQIIYTIHAYDGILSIDQIHRWFFGARRRAEIRLSLLHRNGYIQRSNSRLHYLVPELIVWLTKKGATLIAGQQGVPIRQFPFRATPPWSKLRHDILLNEYRHSMEVAAKKHLIIGIERWEGQDACIRLFRQKIAFRNHVGQRQERYFQPDGMLALLSPKIHERKRRFPLFVELDNATESNRRFTRDKVHAGVQFVHSRVYRDATGYTSTARFLVVVNGPERRFHNLRADVTKAGGAEFFFFTRASLVTPETALTDRIWYIAQSDEPFSLEEYVNGEFEQRLVQQTCTLPRPILL